MKKEIEIELISEHCKACPMLDLTTQHMGGSTRHRCSHLQFCREILGFWKENDKIDELEIVGYIQFDAEKEDFERAKEIIRNIPPLQFPNDEGGNE